MKSKIFLLSSLFAITYTYSQDSLQTKKIDSLIQIIDTTILEESADSTIKQNSFSGFTTYTEEYHFWFSDDQQALKKVVWKINVRVIQSGDTSNSRSIAIIYYHKESLIKIVFLSKDNKVKKNECYFKDNKLIYCSVPNGKEQGIDNTDMMIGVSRMFLSLFNQNKSKLLQKPVVIQLPSHSS